MARTLTGTWYDAFRITSADGTLPLHQIDRKWFAVGDVDIVFPEPLPTGLEHLVGRRGSGITKDLLDEIRHLDNTKLPRTDLASVPGPMRWFTNTYGRHTPAALIHDWLIPDKGEPAKIKEEYADRYFRFMLRAVGVPFFKRSIMWTAVAMRTRAKSRKWWRPALLIAWLATAVVGITTAGAAVTDALWSTGLPFGLTPGTTLVVAALAPFVCAALWWKQWFAAIVAAVAAPVMIPAALLASLAYGTYRALESLFGFLGGASQKVMGLQITITS